MNFYFCIAPKVYSNLSDLIVDAGRYWEICLGDSVILVASGAISYSWDNGTTGDTLIVQPTETRDYIVTGTDTLGYSLMDTVSVTVFPAFYFEIPDTTIQFGDTLLLGTTEDIEILWSSYDTLSIIEVAPTIDTFYTYYASNEIGCIIYDTIFVSVNHFSIDAGENQTICLGDTATLIVTGGISYEWDNGDTTATIRVSPEITTTYEVTGWDEDGNMATASVTINVSQLPEVIIDAPSSICQGESTFISVEEQEGATYL